MLEVEYTWGINDGGMTGLLSWSAETVYLQTLKNESAGVFNVSCNVSHRDQGNKNDN